MCFRFATHTYWKFATTRQFINGGFYNFPPPLITCSYKGTKKKRSTGFFVVYARPHKDLVHGFIHTYIYIIYIFYTYIFFLRLIRYTLRYLISFIIILAFKSVVAWVERDRLGMGREEGETRNGKGSANDKWKTEQMRFWRLAKKKKTKLPVPYKLRDNA